MATMPQHDPIPGRPIPGRPIPGRPIPETPSDSHRDPRDLERAHRAWIHYRKVMRWMVLLSVAAALLALLYLRETGTPMRLHLVIATLAGVFLSVLLGTGLMGLVFVSNMGGHDDAATGAATDGERRP